MKAKKFRKQAWKHWKVEIKGFLKSAGELRLAQPVWPRIPWLRRWAREPSAIPLRVRWGYAWAILRAPGLARSGKLTDYIKQHWPGKADGLHEQGWVRYSKVLGPVRFKCRTRRELPGHLVEIQVQETYWIESKALSLLSPELRKIYNEAKIEGQYYQEAWQEYMELVKTSQTKTTEVK